MYMAWTSYPACASVQSACTISSSMHANDMSVDHWCESSGHLVIDHGLQSAHNSRKVTASNNGKQGIFMVWQTGDGDHCVCGKLVML